MDKKTFLFPYHICTHIFYSNNAYIKHCCLRSMCQGESPVDPVIFKVKSSNFTHFSLNSLRVWKIYLYDKETKYIIAMTNAIVKACSVAAGNFLYLQKCFTNVDQTFHHHYHKIPLHSQLLWSWSSYFGDNSEPSIMLLRLNFSPSSFFFKCVFQSNILIVLLMSPFCIKYVADNKH